MAWKVLRGGAALTVLGSVLVATRTYLPESGVSTATDALLEKLAPHLDRAGQAMEPVRARLAETIEPMRPVLAEKLAEVIEIMQPAMERFAEASQRLAKKVDESSQPLRERVSEVATQHPEAIKVASVVAAVVILLLCIVRRRRRLRETAAKAEFTQVGVEKVASPLRQRLEEPKEMMTLTQTAELLAAKGQGAGAQMRRRRTSSPGPALLKLATSEEHPELLQALNSQTAEELQEIDGCGPVSAEKIVKYRATKGALTSTADLELVGIPKHIAARMVKNWSTVPA